MITLFNSSETKAAIHEDDGRLFRIDPKQVMEVPDNVAEAFMAAWPEVDTSGPAKVNLAKEPWEVRCGPAWEAAKKEHGINLFQKQTIGPDRPPVEEAAVPADAIDPETGRVNEKMLNTHLCTYCQEEFDKVGKLRKHMKNEHNV